MLHTGSARAQQPQSGEAPAISVPATVRAAAVAAPATPPKSWAGSAIANASVFFGNNQQQVLGADAKLTHQDSALAVTGELQVQYGEAAVDTSARTVTKRLWVAGLTANFRPLDVVSGFLTSTYEANLEKRIASRYSLGAGAKWNIVQKDATTASLSLSLSGEHTVPLDSTVRFTDKKLARLAWLGKYHHSFDDRTEITHQTAWQPAASGRYQFLVVSSTELRYKLNGAVALSMVFTDNYDSAAKSRGARGYNDGQMLFGVAAGW
ncbi:MAG TPA: DUF481 domain-containing protein [Gemmatimonadaceae bacterium]|nr:DUF481 domain-containing protein [Gemmatimonadaceae bacterium]